MKQYPEIPGMADLPGSRSILKKLSKQLRHRKPPAVQRFGKAAISDFANDDQLKKEKIKLEMMARRQKQIGRCPNCDYIVPIQQETFRGLWKRFCLLCRREFDLKKAEEMALKFLKLEDLANAAIRRAGLRGKIFDLHRVGKRWIFYYDARLRRECEVGREEEIKQIVISQIPILAKSEKATRKESIFNEWRKHHQQLTPLHCPRCRKLLFLNGQTIALSENHYCPRCKYSFPQPD